MNSPGRIPEHTPSSQCHPYARLYIYYLEGLLDPATHLDAESFIGNWEEDNFSFLFFSSPADQLVKDLLARQSAAILIDQYQMTYDEWHGGTLEVLRVAGFEIVPPWKLADQRNAGRKIVLDPGVVFGTGTHPTTHDCLIALEKIFKTSAIKTVVDLGTGTGLLALAAARLGAEKVLALDFNLLAVKTALRNVRLNQLGRRVVAVQGLAENFIDFPSDLMVSNIHFDVMQRLLTDRALSKTKWFILSGLLRSQAKAVTTLLERQPTKILQTWERDGIWHTFLGKVC
jgi:ribosomal protein L11 methyltransferase